MRTAAERAYPEECCGALVGEPGGAETARSVRYAVALESRERGSRSNAFLIDAGDVLRVGVDAERNGLAMIGVYHSHPDAPARPSRLDHENAWPWLTYLILSVEDGVLAGVRAWRLADDREAFEEEELRVDGQRV